MAILISNGSNNISTANAFFRVESANLSPLGSALPSIASAQTIPVTFANVGNCKGVVLAFSYNTTTTIDRSVIVKLQQFVAGSWVDTLSTVTLTASQINNGMSGSNAIGTWLVPCEFSVSTLITTAASTWRFNVVQTGGTSGTWTLACSSATTTHFFYAAWCDTLATYASGDQIICKDKITVNSNCSFDGIAITGDTARGVCGVLCRSTTPATPEMLEWENAPSASYTMTLKGMFIMSSHSGFRAGTSASRIPVAQKAKIYTDTPNIGAFNFANFVGFYAANAAGAKTSFYAYGEIPAVNRTTFTNALAVGATSITSAVATGWQVGDLIRIGKRDIIGGTIPPTNHSISAISGTTITITPAISHAARVAGGTLIKTGRCGVEFKYVNSGGTVVLALQHVLGFASNFEVNGADVIDQQFSFSQNTASDDTNYSSAWLFQDVNKIYISDARPLVNALTGPSKGVTFNRVNAQNGFITTHFGNLGLLLLNDSWIQDMSRHSFALNKYSITNLVVEGGNDIPWTGQGAQITHTGNRYWGCTYVWRPVLLAGAVDWKNNYYDKCNYPIAFQSTTMVGVKMIDDVFGSSVANVADVAFVGTGYGEIEIANGTGTQGAVLVPTSSIPGTIVRYSNYNATPNDDRCYLTAGNFQRTGYGLGDTTVRTGGTTFGAASSGKFAMRFQPLANAYSENLKWSQNVPTGNIQNKTMTVSVWVKINNAAYYSVTHVKPTLKIDYDNGTVISAVATSDASTGQLLSLTFTPTTTYGQITMSIEGSTTATGTNAYFYIDDINVAYPAGVSLDAGSLDLWASALPVMPTIATFPSLGGVWDEAVNSHTIAGSFGQLMKDTEIKTDDILCLGIIK